MTLVEEPFDDPQRRASQGEAHSGGELESVITLDTPKCTRQCKGPDARDQSSRSNSNGG